MRLNHENRAFLSRGARRAGMAVIGSAVALISVLEIGCGSGNRDSTRSGASVSLVEQRQQAMKKLAEEASQAPCVPADPKKQANEAIRESLMTLLAYPRQAGTYVEPQLLGIARLELYQADDKDVYFYLSPSDSSGERLEQAICRLAVDKSRVEIAKEKQGSFVFANRSFLRTSQKAAFFRVPLDNLRLDSDTPLRFQFEGAVYAPTVEEIHVFMRNERLFDGPLEAIPDSQSYGQPILYNAGIVVAKAGEPSLQRFVNDLTREIAASDPSAREKKIQRLADLISREIAPNPEEGQLNIVKRANESLMTGKADYRNRAVLLGSMLEQIGEDYIFVYSRGFLAVAVKQGRFPARNEHQIKWEDTDWQLIDLTSPGFLIGQDIPKSRPPATKYVQRPRQNSIIVNPESGRSLTFK
ncbi:MAG TPA: hypothetical protein VJZ77_12305 [Blastocatellia bacterium]|nr:hypothetical protein [Blastocatellia bacterium]